MKTTSLIQWSSEKDPVRKHFLSVFFQKHSVAFYKFVNDTICNFFIIP